MSQDGSHPPGFPLPPTPIIRQEAGSLGRIGLPSPGGGGEGSLRGPTHCSGCREAQVFIWDSAFQTLPSTWSMRPAQPDAQHGLLLTRGGARPMALWQTQSRDPGLAVSREQGKLNARCLVIVPRSSMERISLCFHVCTFSRRVHRGHVCFLLETRALEASSTETCFLGTHQVFTSFKRIF